VLTGFAWFAGNFSSQALYLHRGPLLHLALSDRDGRLRGRASRAVAVAGYAAAVVAPLYRDERVTLAISVLLLAFALVRGARDARILPATVALVLAATAVARLAFNTSDALHATLLTYDFAMCALAGGVPLALVRGRPGAAVTDLVVELGDRREDSVRARLARALGDPMLEVAYRLGEGGRYVDAAGRPIVLPTPGSGARVTRVEWGGEVVAALVHDAAVLDDDRLAVAVASAAGLAATNARLQAEVRQQVLELRSSRRRLLRVGDDERRGLEQRLRDGAERRLGAAVAALTPVRPGSAAAERTPGLERARDLLARSLEDLRRLAAGLHPRDLADGGLPAALASLAERAPLPIELTVPAERVTAEVELTAYFVCSEALTNVAKYAAASRASVSVTVGQAVLRVEVADDGRGGADPAGGTGLRGLADRVAALGGTFDVQSHPGGGTRVAAELPLTEPA
jgi:signal transduction histidine kinase